MTSGRVRRYHHDFRDPTVVRSVAGDGAVRTWRYSYEPEVIARAIGRVVPARVADWLDLGIAVHLADRLSPRRAPDDDDSGLQWRRRIRVIVPVRIHAFWTQLHVQTAVISCLDHLTGDRWEIEFVASARRIWRAEVQSHLALRDAEADVALFSGGLDSFVGAAHLATGSRDLVLVSGVPNPRHGSRQRAQIAELRRTIAPRAVQVPVTYELEGSDELRERTQRARAFLHMTLGCVTALLVGQPRLYVCENGVGAINLPLDATQLGTSNARATHPTFLLHMQQLADLVGGAAVKIVNPFQFSTKGQACRHSAVRAAAHAIADTFSCDGFPVRTSAASQCGFCTACVLRRLALEVAGLSDPARAYMRDVCGGSRALPPHVKHGVVVMELQARTLRRCLSATDPWLALAAAYPELERAASAIAQLRGQAVDVCRLQLLRLYCEHVKEWEAFSARALVSARAA